MLKLNKKVLGLSLSLLVAGISQNSYAEGEIIGSVSSIAANHSLTHPANLQDRYVVEKINYHQDSLKIALVQAYADAGDPIAQHQLGDAYRFGQGVTKSDVVALMWYTISAANGDKSASTDKNFTARYMAVDQISLAYEMAERWLKTNK